MAFLRGLFSPNRGIAAFEFFEELEVFFIERQFFKEIGPVLLRVKASDCFRATSRSLRDCPNKEYRGLSRPS
jgi:hypothetical protein